MDGHSYRTRTGRPPTAVTRHLAACSSAPLHFTAACGQALLYWRPSGWAVSVHACARCTDGAIISCPTVGEREKGAHTVTLSCSCLYRALTQLRCVCVCVYHNNFLVVKPQQLALHTGRHGRSASGSESTHTDQTRPRYPGSGGRHGAACAAWWTTTRDRLTELAARPQPPAGFPLPECGLFRLQSPALISMAAKGNLNNEILHTTLYCI